MTMRSLSLLPALRELPGDNTGHRTFRDHITGLVNTDRTMYAAEFAAGASFGLWYIFEDRTLLGMNVPFTGINVDDTLAQAYELQYPGQAVDQSLHEQWQEMIERGPAAMDGFTSGLKGKVAEFNAVEQLEQSGYTNVEIAPDPTQPIWDISAVGPDGQEVFIQVKTGGAEYAVEVQNLMAETPDIQYAVSSEIYDKIAESSPDLIDQMINIGPDHLIVAGIDDGLNTLSSNLGIDIPDGVVDIVPYAGAILASARLIHSVLRTEKEFKAVDRTTRNKIQVVQTLTLMSRMGITTVLAAVGGAGGTAAGSVVPFLGNLVGGIVGTVAGAGMGMYLNRQLQPHMLNLALDITGLTNDDLFYYKNKPRIDQVAVTFRQTTAKLAAPRRRAALPAPA